MTSKARWLAAFALAYCACLAAGAEGSQAADGPKLLDAWPKEGPPLVWKSDFIPAFREGGCGSPVVAGGKVFLFANKQPVDGGKVFKVVTAELLADCGWAPDLPAELAKKVEDAWASKDRPSSAGWEWWNPEQARKEGALDGFLAKKPELDKYIKDFIAALAPEDARKHGAWIRQRLCIAAPMRKFGIPDGLSWDELGKLSKLQDQGYTTSAEWVSVLSKASPKFGISHHISFSPNYEAAWKRAFNWMDTLVCLDAATGSELWRKSFSVDRDLVVKQWRDSMAWGDYCTRLGSSGTPAVWGGKCYFAGSAGLYCLAVEDGKLLWHEKGGPEHATPLVADGRVFHIGCAFDAESGRLLWKSPLGFHKCVARYTSPFLLSSGGRDYVVTTDAAGNPRTSSDDSNYVCLDAETGKVQWTLKAAIGPTMSGDVMVTAMGANKPVSQAYKLTPAGPELLWKGRFNGGGLIHQDHIYGAHAVLFCASMKTGEVNWKKSGKDLISPQILADGKIFGITNDSYVEHNPFLMIEATPEAYTELGRFDPQACTMCRPALADGLLYLRLKDRMACYDLRDHGVYLGGVTATKDALSFHFKQTGGGLTAANGLQDVQLTDASGAAKPAQAKVDGDTVTVDIKNAAPPFGIAAPAGALAGRNGKPAPAFAWNEPRVLKYRKAIEQNIFLKSDLPLQQTGAWSNPAAYAISGAKVTKVELDPQGKGVSLTTDKAWKPGETIALTYPCFAATQGEPRRETLTVQVAEAQRAAAKFVRADTTTLGDWKGKYGSEGAMVAGDKGTTQAPKCAAVALRNHTEGVPWAASEKEPHRPQWTGGNPGRSIKVWTAGDQIFVDLEFTDGKEHQVAMYVVFGNCPISVAVLDADTKEVLDTQADKGDASNRYLIWNLKGSVTLHFTSTAESAEARSINIGGLFIDPAGAGK